MRAARGGGGPSWGAKLLMGLAVTVVFFAVAELAARGLPAVAPRWQGRDSAAVVMVGHPTRLWGMGEGVRQNVEQKATINAMGLRGEPPPLPRPAGRARILVLGDSSFFGHGVADDQTLAAQLERRLRARQIDVDIVNGAIPGYSTEQTRLLLDEQGWALEPTLLLLGNLWSDSTFDHFRDVDLLRTRALFERHPLSRSRLFVLLAEGVDKARGGERGRVIRWPEDGSWPTEGSRRVPLGTYAENLAAIAQDAAARGVGVLFFAPCSTAMLRNPRPNPVWAPYFDAQAAVAAHLGLPLAASCPAMAEAGEIRPQFVDDLHPSPAGLRAWAAVADAALAQAGWPEAPLHAQGAAFDGGALVDTPAAALEGHRHMHTPQSLLFPSGDRQKAAPNANPDAADAPGYPVRIEIVGGQPPYAVQAWGPDGALLAEAKAKGPGELKLRLEEAVPAVRVRVEDAAGGVDEQDLVEDGPLPRFSPGGPAVEPSADPEPSTAPPAGSAPGG